MLLPHDLVSQHLCPPGAAAFTDRGDASGTGYFATAQAPGGPTSPRPRSATSGPAARRPAGRGRRGDASGALVAGGTGDNMGAALGMALQPGDVLLSIGTSGVASTVSTTPVADGSGVVTGFADASGGYLPMVTTMNAAGILDLQAGWLGVDHAGLADLALQSEPGAGGVTLLPYYGGERTPNRPSATGTWAGLRPATTRADLARAAFEALLCSLADAVDQLVAATVPSPHACCSWAAPPAAQLSARSPPPFSADP